MENKIIKKSINSSVNKNRLYKDVQILTSIQPSRNYKNIESLNICADYIYNEFKKLDYYSVEFQKYRIEQEEYKNIIASCGPKDTERIIIGAHYDVCDEQPGADDNASAVAGLLEMARVISEIKPDLKNRIDLVAYTLEEPPYFASEFMGSMVHARALSESNVKIKIMICLEMIGYYTDKEKSQSYPLPVLKLFYPDKGNFIAVVSKSNSRETVKKLKQRIKEVATIDVQSLATPIAIPGINLSDHHSYWKYKYKALMITDTAFYRNPNYHQITDTLETLDFDKMREVVKGLLWAIVNV
jgi:Zn-dependent M28 family amino/carboxypeptidase